MIEETVYINKSVAPVGATSTLSVMEAFYTLQGEGFHQGNAAYFIRLGGCDVGCFWCDVKESWDASLHPQKSIRQIIEEIKLEVNGEPACPVGRRLAVNFSFTA